MKKIFFTLLPLFALAGCSQESATPDFPTGDGPQEMELWCELPSLTAEVGTRAADPTGQLDNTKATNLYFARQDKSTSANSYPGYGGSSILTATRVASTGTTASKVTFDASNKQYYPMEKPYNNTVTTAYNSTKLVGWFPKGSLASGKVTIPVSGNSDILLSGEVEGSYTSQFTSSARIFSFSHQLTYIKVQAKAVDADAPTRWGNITNVAVAKQYGRKCEITLPSTVNFTTETSTPLSLVGTPTASPSLTLVNGTAQDCGYLMLAPVAANGSLSVLVTTVNGGQRTVTVSNGTEGFQKGKTYVVTLEFKSTAMEPSATISAWSASTTNPSVDL
ncbi:lipoprotein [Bacteroides sp.]